MRRLRDLYGDLGVQPNASADDVKRAFRARAKTHHPDAGGDAERYKTLSFAYAVLSDPEKRSQYDAMLRAVAEQQRQRAQQQHAVSVTRQVRVTIWNNGTATSSTVNTRWVQQ